MCILATNHRQERKLPSQPSLRRQVSQRLEPKWTSLPICQTTLFLLSRTASSPTCPITPDWNRLRGPRHPIRRSPFNFPCPGRLHPLASSLKAMIWCQMRSGDRRSRSHRLAQCQQGLEEICTSRVPARGRRMQIFRKDATKAVSYLAMACLRLALTFPLACKDKPLDLALPHALHPQTTEEFLPTQWGGVVRLTFRWPVGLCAITTRRSARAIMSRICTMAMQKITHMPLSIAIQTLH